MNDPLHLVFLCTGNAARSVMGAVMARDRSDRVITRGAGTLSIPGLPMSQRTREALAAFDLKDPDHLSNQLEDADIAWADLVLAFEPQHVRHVRKHHPQGAATTASLKRLVRDLPGTSGTFAERIAALDLGNVEVGEWEEVIDPAGGDQAVFHACAREVSELVNQFLEIAELR